MAQDIDQLISQLAKMKPLPASTIRTPAQASLAQEQISLRDMAINAASKYPSLSTRLNNPNQVKTSNNPLLKILNSGPIKNALLPTVTFLDTGRRTMISLAREGIDLIDGDMSTNASFDDFLRQANDPMYGFGTAFPMSGWGGRIIGLVGDVALDPLTWASLGTNIPAKAMISAAAREAAGLGAKEITTRAALGGTKYIGSAEGKRALASFAARMGRSPEEIQKIALLGRRGASNEFLQQIGMNKAGISFFGGRVRVAGSGALAEATDAFFYNMKKAVIYDRPVGNKLLKLITTGDDYQKSMKIALATGKITSKEAKDYVLTLGAANTRKAVKNIARQRFTESVREIIETPGYEKFADNIHEFMDPQTAYKRAVTDEERRFASLIEQKFDAAWNDVRESMRLVDAEAADKLGYIKEYFPHMVSEKGMRYMDDATKPHVEKLLKYFKVDLFDAPGSFKSRVLEAGDDFFGFKLTQEDIDKGLGHLNKIANKGGFEGEFFETNLGNVLNRYGSYYGEQLGRVAMVQQLLDTGVGMARREIQVIDEDAALALREGIDKANSNITKATEDVQNALDDLTGTLSEQVGQIDQKLGKRLNSMKGNLKKVAKTRRIGEGEDALTFLVPRSAAGYHKSLDTIKTARAKLTEAIGYLKSLIDESGSKALFVEGLTDQYITAGKKLKEIEDLAQRIFYNNSKAVDSIPSTVRSGSAREILNRVTEQESLDIAGGAPSAIAADIGKVTAAEKNAAERINAEIAKEFEPTRQALIKEYTDAINDINEQLTLLKQHHAFITLMGNDEADVIATLFTKDTQALADARRLLKTEDGKLVFQQIDDRVGTTAEIFFKTTEGKTLKSRIDPFNEIKTSDLRKKGKSSGYSIEQFGQLISTQHINIEDMVDLRRAAVGYMMRDLHAVGGQIENLSPIARKKFDRLAQALEDISGFESVARNVAMKGDQQITVEVGGRTLTMTFDELDSTSSRLLDEYNTMVESFSKYQAAKPIAQVQDEARRWFINRRAQLESTRGQVPVSKDELEDFLNIFIRREEETGGLFDTWVRDVSSAYTEAATLRDPQGITRPLTYAELYQYIDSQDFRDVILPTNLKERIIDGSLTDKEAWDRWSVFASQNNPETLIQINNMQKAMDRKYAEYTAHQNALNDALRKSGVSTKDYRMFTGGRDAKDVLEKYSNEVLDYYLFSETSKYMRILGEKLEKYGMIPTEQHAVFAVNRIAENIMPHLTSQRSAIRKAEELINSVRERVYSVANPSERPVALKKFLAEVFNSEDGEVFAQVFGGIEPAVRGLMNPRRVGLAESTAEGELLRQRLIDIIIDEEVVPETGRRVGKAKMERGRGVKNAEDILPEPKDMGERARMRSGRTGSEEQQAAIIRNRYANSSLASLLKHVEGYQSYEIVDTRKVFLRDSSGNTIPKYAEYIKDVRENELPAIKKLGANKRTALTEKMSKTVGTKNARKIAKKYRNGYVLPTFFVKALEKNATTKDVDNFFAYILGGQIRSASEDFSAFSVIKGKPVYGKTRGKIEFQEITPKNSYLGWRRASLDSRVRTFSKLTDPTIDPSGLSQSAVDIAFGPGGHAAILRDLLNSYELEAKSLLEMSDLQAKSLAVDARELREQLKERFKQDIFSKGLEEDVRIARENAFTRGSQQTPEELATRTALGGYDPEVRGMVGGTLGEVAKATGARLGRVDETALKAVPEDEIARFAGQQGVKDTRRAKILWKQIENLKLKIDEATGETIHTVALERNDFNDFLNALAQLDGAKIEAITRGEGFFDISGTEYADRIWNNPREYSDSILGSDQTAYTNLDDKSVARYAESLGYRSMDSDGRPRYVSVHRGTELPIRSIKEIPWDRVKSGEVMLLDREGRQIGESIYYELDVFEGQRKGFFVNYNDVSIPGSIVSKRKIYDIATDVFKLDKIDKIVGKDDIKDLFVSKTIRQNTEEAFMNGGVRVVELDIKNPIKSGETYKPEDVYVRMIGSHSSFDDRLYGFSQPNAVVRLDEVGGYQKVKGRFGVTISKDEFDSVFELPNIAGGTYQPSKYDTGQLKVFKRNREIAGKKLNALTKQLTSARKMRNNKLIGQAQRDIQELQVAIQELDDKIVQFTKKANVDQYRAGAIYKLHALYQAFNDPTYFMTPNMKVLLESWNEAQSRGISWTMWKDSLPNDGRVVQVYKQRNQLLDNPQLVDDAARMRKILSRNLTFDGKAKSMEWVKRMLTDFSVDDFNIIKTRRDNLAKIWQSTDEYKHLEKINKWQEELTALPINDLIKKGEAKIQYYARVAEKARELEASNFDSYLRQSELSGSAGRIATEGSIKYQLDNSIPTFVDQPVAQSEAKMMNDRIVEAAGKVTAELEDKAKQMSANKVLFTDTAGNNLAETLPPQIEQMTKSVAEKELAQKNFIDNLEKAKQLDAKTTVELMRLSPEFRKRMEYNMTLSKQLTREDAILNMMVRTRSEMENFVTAQEKAVFEAQEALDMATAKYGTDIRASRSLQVKIETLENDLETLKAIKSRKPKKLGKSKELYYQEVETWQAELVDQMKTLLGDDNLPAPVKKVMADYARKKTAVIAAEDRLGNLTEAAIDGMLQQPMKILKEFDKGFVQLSTHFPNIGVPEHVKEIFDNVHRMQDPAFVIAMRQLFGGYNKFFKAYATLSPGFHLRNALSNTFMFVAGGAQPKNILEGINLMRSWERAAATGMNFEGWIATLPDDVAKRVITARNVSAASGDGLAESLFSDLAFGSKLVNNKFTQTNKKIGSYIEKHSRFAFSYDAVSQGMDFDTALARTRKFLIDYEERSTLDKVMTQIVPFWMWTSRNLPLQVQTMWTNPRPYAIYNSFKRNFNEDDERDIVPEWMRQIGAFKLPFGGNLYATPDFGFNRVEETVSKLASPTQLAGDLTPLLRVPAEIMSNKMFYNNREFSNTPIEVSGGPAGLLQPFLQAAGYGNTSASGKQLMNEKAYYALRNLFPLLSTAERMSPSLPAYQERGNANSWLGFLGVPVKQVTPEMQASEIRKQQKAMQSLIDLQKVLGQ